MKVFDSGYEFVLDGAGEEVGVSVCFGNSDSALEEVESRAELGMDVAREKAGTAMDDAAELVAGDMGFAEEEGEDGDDVGERGGEDFGAHGYGAAEVGRGEADGVEEGDDGFEVGEWGGDEGRVDCEEGEEIYA